MISNADVRSFLNKVEEASKGVKEYKGKVAGYATTEQSVASP